jgi:3-dehydroquinate dehydratase / shikimate dehydrogenase
MTLLAVPITGRTTDEATAQVARAVNVFGADAIEFRLDHMSDVNLAAVMATVPQAVSVIVTARDPAEGGVWRATDSERLNHLARALSLHPDFIDIEGATWWRSPETVRGVVSVMRPGPSRGARKRPCRLILSFHDFVGRPNDLAERLAALGAKPCHVAKIVWRAESVCDSLLAFDLMRQARKPVIAIAMGEAGLASRVLARKFGAFLSFGSLEAESASAPGQISIGTMKSLYRWDSIHPRTAVYGVIGCPIAHSMSPAIHNAAFTRQGLDAVYLPFRVEPGYPPFEAFVRGLMDRPWMDLRGLSVTIPHKENALRLVGDSVEPLARQIGAVNTLVFDASGKVRGLNTDYAGALDALTGAMGCARSDLAGLPVAVLGAGGASRGVVAGLRHCGCEVTVYNRTYPRAQALADEFGARAQPLEALRSLQARIVVNTTSIGMHPGTDETPLPMELLKPGMVVFDNVYNPIQTRLLRESAAMGCLTVSGVDMFVNQATAQFEAWTGQPAPRNLMRDVVVQHLTGASRQ